MEPKVQLALDDPRLRSPLGRGEPKKRRCFKKGIEKAPNQPNMVVSNYMYTPINKRKTNGAETLLNTCSMRNSHQEQT